MLHVVIAEDQRLVREAVGALLAREEDITVIGEAGTGREAVEVCIAREPDVLVLDISLPDMDGVNVVRSLRPRLPGLKVIALSVHSEAHFVREMIKAGAAGYVSKAAALAELVQAVRLVVEGERYISPELEPALAAPAASGISPREREVLSLLAAGRRSSEIAQALGISAGTVEAHRRNLMRKLDLHSVADLTRYAVREGLVSP
jgi:DNA-binding NarL/FixJ family response regulator